MINTKFIPTKNIFSGYMDYGVKKLLEEYCEFTSGAKVTANPDAMTGKKSYSMGVNMTSRAVSEIMRNLPFAVTVTINDLASTAMREYYDPQQMSFDFTDEMVIQKIDSQLIQKEADNVNTYNLTFKEYLKHKFGIKSMKNVG